MKRIEKYVDSDNFMVTYGDGVANINIKELVDFHQSHGKLATLTGVFPLSRFGELIIKGKQVSSFREKPQSSGGFMSTYNASPFEPSRHQVVIVDSC
ncbi:unnamed protein product [marine sediment metagenome]|uniref:Uncharacterized protein n=1 Tax=marine sediment metagenome TaxID=412755 RepID=X1D743_9ZZZZ